MDYKPVARALSALLVAGALVALGAGSGSAATSARDVDTSTYAISFPLHSTQQQPCILPDCTTRTFDLRITGSVTTTNPVEDVVAGMKWTETYKGIRLQFRVSYVNNPAPRTTFLMAQVNKNGRTFELGGLAVGTLTVRGACVKTKRFRIRGQQQITGGPFRVRGGPFSGYTVLLQTKFAVTDYCDFGSGPELVHVNPVQVEGRPGKVTGGFGHGTYLSWDLPRDQRPGRLAFPLDRLYAGKSFEIKVSGQRGAPLAVLPTDFVNAAHRWPGPTRRERLRTGPFLVALLC